MQSKPALVFTSAGDRSNVQQWLTGGAEPRDWDLFVCYYGDAAAPACLAAADRGERRKGGKFPNLHAMYEADRGFFEQYDAILVADDDLEVDAPAISAMFEVRRALDLFVVQAAFDERQSKSSWRHTVTEHGDLWRREQKKPRPGTMSSADLFALRDAWRYLRLGYGGEHRVRFTNFVEVTCPLFRTDALLDFLRRAYDPRLVGWGVDWCFCQHTLRGIDAKGWCDGSLQTVIAIVDSIVVVNPLDAAKRGGEAAGGEAAGGGADCGGEVPAIREIERLQSTHHRQSAWAEVAKERKLIQYVCMHASH